MDLCDRYDRQMLMPQIGEEGQRRLLASHVVVVGAGGLGSPVLTFLVNAGVGKISFFDDDVVSATNLQRQFLYAANQVGEPKTDCACSFLSARNPDVQIFGYPHRFDDSPLVRQLVESCDAVVDCCDNFQTRYLISDLCESYHKPMIYGAINALSGQVAILCHPSGKATYRTLFPNPSQAQADKAVLGPTPGVIGSVQALQTILLLAGSEDVLIDKLWTMDLRSMNSYVFDL